MSKCFFVVCCVFLHKFKQRLSYIAWACVEKYTVLENDSYIMTCCRNDGASAFCRMGTHWVLRRR